MSKLSTYEVLSTIIVPIIPIVALILALLFFATGCPAQRTTCQVIKVANGICTLIEYAGDDGSPQQVEVTPQELRGFAREASVRREVERQMLDRDAGGPPQNAEGDAGIDSPR